MLENPLIHTTDWNILVILDAMRYDYFKKYNQLKGHLQSVSSGAACTIDWLLFNFPDKYPYVYYSANPICNSLTPVGEFFGKKHFTVIDVWKTHWDEEYKTVLPEDMTEAVRDGLDGEKVILHYMQPHFPSLGEERFFREGMFTPTPPFVGKMEASRIYYTVTEEKLIRAYIENVERISNEMVQLIKYIPKDQKVIVTSDHGELLGEGGIRGHPCGVLNPILSIVPWFEVKL